MKRMLLASGVVCLGAAIAIHATAVFAADHAVSALSSPDQFQDASGDNETTITAGDTVTWSWSGGNPHNVKAENDAFTGSGPFATADTHTVQFNTPGNFPYYCEVHGAPGAGMHGTIIVQAGSTNTPQPTNTSAPGTTNTPTRTPTRTATPLATSTVTAVPTSVAGTATPIVAVPISATEPPASGGARPAVTAPSVGTGAGGGSSRADAMVVALAVVGFAMLSAAATVRRRS